MKSFTACLSVALIQAAYAEGEEEVATPTHTMAFCHTQNTQQLEACEILEEAEKEVCTAATAEEHETCMETAGASALYATVAATVAAAAILM